MAPLMKSGIELLGCMMSGSDAISSEVYEKFPDIHRLLVQNILTLELIPSMNQNEINAMPLGHKKELVKSALWALSNIVACPPIILEKVINDEITIKTVTSIGMYVTGKYEEVFSEALFVLTNIITNAT